MIFCFNLKISDIRKLRVDISVGHAANHSKLFPRKKKEIINRFFQRDEMNFVLISSDSNEN